MSVLNDIPQKVKEFATQNSTTILTAGGVVGTVATGVLAARAGIKAARILDEARHEKTIAQRDDVDVVLITELSKKEKLVLVGPQFIPAVITGTVTVTAIIFAHRISAQKAAALAAAYGLLDNRFEEYKEKVAEKMTGTKKTQMEDEIAQGRIDENPPSSQVVIIGGGDVLCLDAISGRYFRSGMEQIKRAESEINQELFDSQMVSLSDFYDKIGLERTMMSDILGWSAFEDGILEFQVTTGVTPDQQPCFVITPSRNPNPNFTRLID
jgi:hypothetical protein